MSTFKLFTLGLALPLGLAAQMATPFVPDALMQALSEQRGYLGAIQESGHRALVDLIADMPPERRAALADELAEGRRR
jgi:hypothetical protein